MEAEVGLIGRIALVFIGLLCMFVADGGHPTAHASTDAPVIQSYEPAELREWSNIEVTGSFLQAVDGTCSLSVSGTPAYIYSCSDSAIGAVLPWVSGAVELVVSRDEATSQPMPVQIAAMSGVVSSGVEGGLLEVRFGTGADVPGILANAGLGTQSATPVAPLDDEFLGGWHVVSVQPGEEVAKARLLAGYGDVIYAGPRSALRSSDMPNDYYYANGTQWALTRIAAADAWTVSKGNGVKIAVIDTGVTAGHPDLAGHVVPGKNCDGGTDVFPLGGNPHGTRVAGMAAAVTDNGPDEVRGLAGAGWNAAVMPMRLDWIDSMGTCSVAYGDVYLIDEAVASGVGVINLSFYVDGSNPLLCDAIARARAFGVLVVASAGNFGSSVGQHPATCGKSLAVGATTRQAGDPKAGYSNYGSWVDISAPGGEGVVGACSPDLGQRVITTDFGSGFTYTCGTSFAAPLVSGVAALLAARGFHACEIEDTLLNTANTDPTNWADGAGRINARKALEWWLPGKPIVTSFDNIPDGSLLRADGSATVYLVRGGAKWPISSPAELADMGFSWREVQCVDDSFPFQVPSIPPGGTLVREFGGSGTVYVVHCEARFGIPDQATMNLLLQHGFASGPVGGHVVPPGELGGIGTTPVELYFSDDDLEFCNLRETDAQGGLSLAKNYVICTGTGSPRKVSLLSEGGAPPEYKRDRLYAGWPAPSRAFEGVLWDGRLSVFPNGNLNNCSDSDGDLYSQHSEAFQGTNREDRCPATVTANDEPIDAWPPDVNDSRSVDLSDISIVGGPAYNSFAPGPPYVPRYDLNASGTIDLSEISMMGAIGTYNTTCQP
jgi:hypothetical protein